VLVRAGIVLVSADAFAAGSALVPGPGSDRDQDWIWTGQIFLSFGAEASVIPDQLSAMGVIDSKAQRVIRTNTALAFVVETIANEINDQGGTIDFVYGWDTLVSV